MSTETYDVYTLTGNPTVAGGSATLDSGRSSGVTLSIGGGGTVLGTSTNQTFSASSLSSPLTYDGYATVTLGNGTTQTGIVASIGSTYYFIVGSGGNLQGDTVSNSTFVQDAPPNSGEFNIGDGKTGCFVAGTLIRTPQGERAIETLQAGDLVLTASGASAPVRWLGVTIVSMMFADPVVMRPIRISAGALGENVPSQDLKVSPGHALFVGGVLATAQALLNGSTITSDEDTPLTFAYYHLELDQHDLLIANGAPAESFLAEGAEMLMDNWKDRPTGGAHLAGEMPYPRVKTRRQLPAAVRTLLQDHALEISGSVANAA